MKKVLWAISWLILPCLVLATISLSLFGDEKKEQEKFSGTVTAPPGIYTETRQSLNMVVDNWTTPEEVTQLYHSIKDVDAKEKYKIIRKKVAGYIWFTGSMRLPVNMASSEDLDQGRKIRLIVDRPILPEDMTRSLSEAETHFGAVEFTLDEENKGEGYVFGRVVISINEDGTIGFRPLASVKQMLTTVRKH